MKTPRRRRRDLRESNELELFQLLQNPNVSVSAQREMEDGGMELEITVEDKSGKVCVKTCLRKNS